MATTREMQRQIDELKEILRAYGVPLPRVPQDAGEPEHRDDYIEHGSPAHAVFLGLVIVDEQTDTDQRLTYTSQKSQTTYMLEDEVTPFMGYPDPTQVARLVLRQKVSAFEAGKPPVSDKAPALWIPVDQPL